MEYALELLINELESSDCDVARTNSYQDAIKTLQNVIKLRAITSEIPARREDIDTIFHARTALEGPIIPQESNVY